MKESVFQFTTPVLAQLNFQPSNAFKGADGSKVNLAIHSDVSVQQEGSYKAHVTLTITIGDALNAPFYVKAQETALFSWTDTYTEEEVAELLSRNAPSLLLSYLRPAIAFVTGASKFNSFNLPFMSFRP